MKKNVRLLWIKVRLFNRLKIRAKIRGVKKKSKIKGKAGKLKLQQKLILKCFL